jgi:hypothetical protein
MRSFHAYHSSTALREGDADDIVTHSTALQNNPHLALFQSTGKMLRQDPTAVIAQLSAWLSDENSPPYWAGFALSIRGLAYEVMDENELARLDYIEGSQLYDAMAEELGKEPVQRLETNINFIRFRLGNLPPPRKFALMILFGESDFSWKLLVTGHCLIVAILKMNLQATLQTNPQAKLRALVDLVQLTRI